MCADEPPNGGLTGARVIEVIRGATDRELEQLGWTRADQGGLAVGPERPVVIETADGRVYVPSRDPELNGPGHLVEIDGEDVLSHTPGDD